jgi:hypothetical protein
VGGSECGLTKEKGEGGMGMGYWGFGGGEVFVLCFTWSKGVMRM